MIILMDLAPLMETRFAVNVLKKYPNTRSKKYTVTSLITLKHKLYSTLQEQKLSITFFITINVPLILKMREIIFFFAGKLLYGTFQGTF